MKNSDTSIGTKPHFIILDGLRGVAAVVVIWFHIFEAFATSHLDQKINHGYLAVDFFFLLSGFVIGYAYDNRWATMSVKEFILRRLVRLHPMVVIGALIGGLMFYAQACDVWDVSSVSFTALLGATLLNALLIPSTIGTEIRGLGEMFPLNGPAWSLFFEYIGSLLYVLLIRRLSTLALSVLLALFGLGLASYAIFGPDGDICVGYSLTGLGFLGGWLRLVFSFSAGLLLFRIFKPGLKIKGAFWIAGLALLILLSVPRIGNADSLWLNGLYDTLCCFVCFPALLYLGASGVSSGKFTTAACKFLGDISYPLYMVHYPFIYLYYAWVKNNNLTFADSLHGAIALFVGSIVLAYLCLKLYDLPIRRKLKRIYQD